MPAMSTLPPPEGFAKLESLVEAAAHLSSAELDTLKQRLNALSASRRVPVLSEEETKLLLQIQDTSAPLSLREERQKLLAIQEERSFNDTERATFLRLTNEIETHDAERIVLLSELARLRGISLSEAMRQLGLAA
jgi:hypothetical protein